ncbi:type II toxin-antitoxin system RelE/ParE family toxin [Salinicola sp. JS01]|uniref:type II toxin-antitoxin system RelE/ParE family toxin n=1 Tax=Salinicola sp. JS01 TaxID=3050071 RepID=UPI00255BAC13|nr:type II toxin-antitoxin system RelE/ParE family toxin [Salinicola sp. JS01]WIX32218.1 type II toxin-antitoxin system RelE/ParE family toxin [Salinicola sp. JS01]
MAELLWSQPSLQALDEIAEYIALDNPAAARALVARVLRAVERLVEFPASGRQPPELPGSGYREVVVPPCRVFYRQEGERILIVHLMREERALRRYMLDPE